MLQRWHSCADRESAARHQVGTLQSQTLTERSKMLDVLASPWSCVGAVAGLLIAVVVHWLAPSADAVQVGAWLVGIGWVAGLAWELMSK